MPPFKRLVFLASWLIASLAQAEPARECASQPSVIGVEKAVSTSFQLKSAEGLCLQGYQWTPATAPRGVVIVAHGLRDHANRYARLVTALAAQGWVVQAQDMRGHGNSGGERQRFESIADLVADLDLGVQRARSTYPELPVFLFGHSLGGLISTTYVSQAGTQIRGVMLSGPLLVLPESATWIEKKIALLIAAVAPGAHIQKIDDTLFLREPASRAQLSADPLVDHRSLPAASARAILGALESLPLKVGSITVPVLAMHGLADESAPIEGSRWLMNSVKSVDKTLLEVPLAKHDLVNEPEGLALSETMVKWIQKRL